MKSMKSRYLLDTNVLSEPLRPDPDEGVLAMIDRHGESLATSSVVWHELQFGARRLPKGRRRTLIEAYLQNVVAPSIPILPYDEAAAEWHASERARLARRGAPLPFADGQIAATARVNGLVLVTRNVADFEPYEGLRLENWHS